MATTGQTSSESAHTRKTDPGGGGASVAPVPAQRILIAEDNKVTQDLLKLLLNQRGHKVDVAADGQDALEALEQAHYDVVLMDFHLPKMDGLKVANSFRTGKGSERQPRFIAITADMEGLLGHVDNCENFDNILPKPFDLERVCKVVEGEVEEIYVPAEPVTDATPLRAVNERTAPPKTISNHIQSLSHEFLHWPDDFENGRMSARFLQAMLDDASRFDAILIRQPCTPQDLSVIWSTKALHTLPVIDLSGTLGHHADLDGASLQFGDTDKVANLINDFHNRRLRLHHETLYSDDPGDKLLGRVYVSGEPVTPTYDAGVPAMVAYNTTLDAGLVVQEAAKQCELGYFERAFFDRFHVCGACGSSRIHIREECSECRSPNLREEAYLHHFTCAYQGPESDFRQGDDLVCPKCRKELSHFSVDYDKPGSMLVCSSCHRAGSEPLIGFVCMDCHAHTDADVAGSRDVYAYRLTDRGVGYLETGRAMLGRQHRALRLSHLPLEVIVAVNGELKVYQEQGTPFTVLDISYRNQRRIEHEHGLREFEQARELFLENLRATLRRQDHVIKGIAYDYAVVHDVDPDEVRDGLEYIREEATAGLRQDLGIAVHVFGPEDFA